MMRRLIPFFPLAVDVGVKIVTQKKLQQDECSTDSIRSDENAKIKN